MTKHTELYKLTELSIEVHATRVGAIMRRRMTAER